jgi:hypothetical protein
VSSAQDDPDNCFN